MLGALARHRLVLNPAGLSEEEAAGLETAIVEGLERSSDLCQITPPLCAGNLGIPRAQMPQVAADVLPLFLAALAAQGYDVVPSEVQVGTLRATQREIDARNVLQMLKSFRAGTFPKIRDPVVVSAEGYVLDGHHRWITLLADDPRNRMRVYRVGMPMAALLEAARGVKGVVQRAFGTVDVPAAANPAGWFRRAGQAARSLYAGGKLDFGALAVLLRAARAADQGDAGAAHEVAATLAAARA